MTLLRFSVTSQIRPQTAKKDRSDAIQQWKEHRVSDESTGYCIANYWPLLTLAQTPRKAFPYDYRIDDLPNGVSADFSSLHNSTLGMRFL